MQLRRFQQALSLTGKDRFLTLGIKLWKVTSVPKRHLDVTNARVERIGALLTTPPSSDLHELAKSLFALRGLVQEEIAMRLEPALNAHLRVSEPTEAEAKKRLGAEVADVLTKLNLSIRCPVTKQNCVLHINPANEKNPHGRFELRPRGSDKPTITRADIVDLLPLQLMDAQPRREGLTEWRRRTAKRRPDDHCPTK